MLTRFMYYFRKKFLAPDANELQASIEDGIDRVLAERGMTGLISSGHTVVGAGAGFTLDISSGGANPLFAYDPANRRVALPSEPYTTVDLGSQFTLPGVGNEKWITIYLRAAKVESQPEKERKPPVFTTVNFRITEGFEIVVEEGVEGPPTPAKPALNATDVYLADILLVNGITDFTGVTIETNRKRVEPLFDASDRGVDGVTIRYVLSAIASGKIRFRDIEGADQNFEDAVLAAIGLTSFPDASNRMTVLNDVAHRYFPVISHPTGITQSRGSGVGPGITGPFTYALNQFVVTDPSSKYDPTKVIGVFIRCFLDNDSSEYNIDFTMPDGAFQTFLSTAPGGAAVDENSPGALIEVPIDVSQASSFDGRINLVANPGPGTGPDLGTFTIVGIRQLGIG